MRSHCMPLFKSLVKSNEINTCTNAKTGSHNAFSEMKKLKYSMRRGETRALATNTIMETLNNTLDSTIPHNSPHNAIVANMV